MRVSTEMRATVPRPALSAFREKDPADDTQGNGDDRGDEDEDEGADDGVGDSAAGSPWAWAAP